MTIEFYGSQTWVNTLLDAAISLLVNGLPGMTADRVFLSAWDESMHLDFPPADRFVTLFTPSFPVDQTDVEGGGAINTAFDSRLDVKAFVRIEADIEGRSGQYLSEQVRGALVFAQQVISLLQTWPGPDDGTGVSQLRRPLRLTGAWTLSWKTVKDGKRWGVISIPCEMSFVAALGSPYP